LNGKQRKQSIEKYEQKEHANENEADHIYYGQRSENKAKNGPKKGDWNRLNEYLLKSIEGCNQRYDDKPPPTVYPKN